MKNQHPRWKFCANQISSQQGAVLGVVILFAVISTIAVIAYVTGQLLLTKPGQLVNPVKEQARLNAFSGIYKGLDSLKHEVPPSNNPPPINAQDPSYGNNNSIDEMTEEDSVRINPYSVDGFGTTQFSIELSGNQKLVKSNGVYRDLSKEVTAYIGGQFNVPKDTVLVLETPGQPQGGRISGTIGYDIINQSDTLSKKKTSAIRQQDLDAARTWYQQFLANADTSLITNLPITVSSQSDVEKLPDTVNAPLIIKDDFGGFVWQQKRRICVLGDVQFSGSPTVCDLEFIVSGTISMFDKSTLKQVTLFSQHNVIITDKCVFSGSIFALGGFSASGNSKIINKSSICIYAVASTASKKDNKGKPALPDSILIAERADIDALFLSASPTKSMIVRNNTGITGIVYCKGPLCIQGAIKGFVHAKLLYISNLPQSNASTPVAGNSMSGSIQGLDDFNGYTFPFYMGKSVVLYMLESP